VATKRAKTLDNDQFQKLVSFAKERATLPERDELILALSFKAGLRVGEIQKIDLSAMLDAEGNIAENISVFSHVGKKKRERSIPMHPMIRDALIAFRKAYPSATFVAISSQPFRWAIARGEKVSANAKHKRMSLTALTNYYWDLINDAGFTGASSHSGRRTFGTSMARQANLHHCSLRDVQMLMGHARLDTTESYIEVSKEARSLVAAL